ncbi:MAG: SPOR domain-containing protein [Bacteroidales bacterium]|mgnify:CR=1 FL=1|nr:SPOR domain-containing protein [Bacteroidales bacterium]
MRKLIFLFLVALLSGNLVAQNHQNIVESLKRSVPGQGRIVIVQDARLEALVGVNLDVISSTDQMLKVPGFRVQIYAGKNSRESRAEATSFGEKVKELFPELPVYTLFVSPRWLCRIGDFRSIEEADAMMRQLEETGAFKEITIVREQINIPL